MERVDFVEEVATALEKMRKPSFLSMQFSGK